MRFPVDSVPELLYLPPAGCTEAGLAVRGSARLGGSARPSCCAGCRRSSSPAAPQVLALVRLIPVVTMGQQAKGCPLSCRIERGQVGAVVRFGVLVRRAGRQPLAPTLSAPNWLQATAGAGLRPFRRPGGCAESGTRGTPWNTQEQNRCSSWRRPRNPYKSMSCGKAEHVEHVEHAKNSGYG